MQDRDLARATAWRMIRQHGGSAAAVAERRAETLEREGSYEGRHLWLSIAEAIHDVQSRRS